MSVTFIEASAGTGKTYTLVNRVIEALKRGIRAESILLVTFTEKATDELKTRIRLGLREAYRNTEDETLARALEDWTSLTIATIHGFCRTLLTQFPLESGVSFEPEMVDQAERSRRLLRDELRPRLKELGTLPLWAGLEDEEELLSLAARAIHEGVFEKPLLHPNDAEAGLFDQLRADLEARAGAVWEAASGLDLRLPADTAAAFGNDAGLLNATTSKVPYRVARSVGAAGSWPELLDVLWQEDVAGALEKWEGAAFKKTAAPPSTGPLAQVRAASRALSEVLRTVESKTGLPLGEFLKRCARYRLLAAVVPPVLERRSDRELTYRDLVERVRTLALSGALDKAALRWKAVFVDEFQDTDRDQWEIFSRLFLHDGCDLTVVGDPKQSIYRFRGADLNVYRAAREQVGAATFEVLDENFRSTQAMVNAVNELFDPSRTAWPRPEDFVPSRKGNKPIASLFSIAGGIRAELPPVSTRNTDSAEDWHRHLVAEALSLLRGHELDDGINPARPVSPADILVLVRRNREAETVAALLESKGVPVTVGGTGGLLATREAAEVTLFLKALESPASLSAARALTWTRLLAGADAEALAVALQAAQEDRLRGAFVRAFRRVAAAADGLPDGGGLEMLLARPGGARAVTNAEHVLEFVQERFHRGEILHGQAALSLERWRAERRQEDEIDLRRDGDSPVVRVLTVHAAKGLEAPIVLHGWPDNPRAKDSPWIVADGVDFLLTPEGRAAEAAAEAAETLRLRYVALTRARSYQVIPDERGTPLPTWTAEAWRELPRWSPPLEHHRPPALGRPISGLESRHPWVESHSGLWRRSQGEANTVTSWDRPQAARDTEIAEESLSDHLPAGPAFGDLVHDVLETADWRGWADDADEALKSASTAAVDEHVQRHRSRLGMPGLGRAVERWLGRVLSQPLALGDDVVRFTDLSPGQTRRELEFHLPFAHDRQRVFRWGGREFTVHPGYLTGRIDVIFAWHGKLYLADWKTNRLTGQTPEDVMAEAGYDLQAQWYWEALTRLCRVQNEPLEPGGILYVFLRGAGDRPAGVFLSPEHLAAQRTLAPFLRDE